jgi:hypothetical protein
MMRALLAAILFLSLLSHDAAAQENPAAPRPARHTVTVRLGSLGVGVEGGRLLGNHVGVRVGGHYMAAGWEMTPEDASFRTDMKMQTIRTVADLYPMKTRGLHLTAGAVMGERRMEGTGQFSADGMITLNGNEYSFADIGALTGRVRYPSVAPYVGIGLSRPIKRGMKFSLGGDLGIVLGRAQITLHSSNGAQNAALTRDLQVEQEKIQDMADRIPFLPVTQMVGLSFRF